MIVKIINRKTLHKHAINYVTQCESEPQDNESTIIVATVYSKARATTLTRYHLKTKFSEKNVNCSQVSAAIKTDSIMNTLVQVISKHF